MIIMTRYVRNKPKVGIKLLLPESFVFTHVKNITPCFLAFEVRTIGYVLQSLLKYVTTI